METYTQQLQKLLKDLRNYFEEDKKLAEATYNYDDLMMELNEAVQETHYQGAPVYNLVDIDHSSKKITISLYNHYDVDGEISVDVSGYDEQGEEVELTISQVEKWLLNYWKEKYNENGKF